MLNLPTVGINTGGNDMLIGIEGIVCAGKSTLASALCKTQLFAVVEEYGVFTKGHHNFPHFPPKNAEDSINAANYFIGIEKMRCECLYALMATFDHPHIVVDRTYHSCLAFDYAVSEFVKFDATVHATKCWNDAIKIEPDITIILDIDQQTMLERDKKRNKGLLAHFKDSSFCASQRDYYLQLARQDSTRYTVFDGRLPTEDIVQCVTQLIQ